MHTQGPKRLPSPGGKPHPVQVTRTGLVGQALLAVESDEIGRLYIGRMGQRIRQLHGQTPPGSGRPGGQGGFMNH